MRRSFLGLLLALAAGGVGRVAAAQGPPPATIPAERLPAFARARVAIDLLRDQAHAELAEPKNKKDEVMAQLREKLRARVAQALKEQGLTEAEFDRYTFIASTDTAQRRLVDEAVAQLTRKGTG